MRERRVLKKILGVISAVVGAVIIIEVIPLVGWYIILGSLFVGLIIFLLV